ncbi:FkbM family methyltransferase [Sagittula sp. S175]|uniref:FkbM family methyltransferase n=1 Tax=Sagittula sp. S175 TaxID=3415129 RepID=UPI003C79F16C
MDGKIDVAEATDDTTVTDVAAATERNPYLRSRGLRIPKHPELTVGRVRAALKEGTYERKECDAVMKVVNPGDTVLELGAGMGYMSTLLAAKKKVKKVLTFEANPTLIDYIKSVHDANGVDNVEVRNALLSPEAGDPVPFYIRKNFLASSMDGEIDKEAITGEDLIERQAIGPVLEELQPDVLVCDIEGAEAELLPAGDWSSLRCAVIELHPQWIGQKGVQAVFDAMQKAGLTFYPKASEGKVVTFRKGW